MSSLSCSSISSVPTSHPALPMVDPNVPPLLAPSQLRVVSQSPAAPPSTVLPVRSQSRRTLPPLSRTRSLLTERDRAASSEFLQAIVAAKPSTMNAAGEIFAKIASALTNKSDLEITWKALCEEVNSLQALKKRADAIWNHPRNDLQTILRVSLMSEQKMICDSAQALLESCGKIDPVLGDEWNESHETAFEKGLAREMRLETHKIGAAEEYVRLQDEIAEMILQDEVAKLVLEVNQIERLKAQRKAPQ